LAAAPDRQPFAKTETGPGGATLTLRLDTTRLALAEEATLTLTVEAAAPVEVDPVAPLTPSRQWLVASGEPEVTTVDGDRMRWRQEFRLAALQAGALPLPLAPLHYRTGSGDACEFVWSAPTLQVSTTVLRPQIGEARDNTAPDLELPPAPWAMWPILIATAAIGGASVIVWRVRRGWKPKQRVFTAEERALADLDRLATENEATGNEADPFSTGLAEILRLYLGEKFALPTSGWSTAELLAALDGTGRLPIDLRDELAALFERCDLAKFARAPFGPEERRTMTEQTRAWIRRLPALLLPAPTERTSDPVAARPPGS
jgi:hypothetical protein